MSNKRFKYLEEAKGDKIKARKIYKRENRKERKKAENKNLYKVELAIKSRAKMLGDEMELPILMQFRVGPQELATIINKLKEEKDFGPLRSMSALGRFLIEFTAANIVDNDEEIMVDYDESMKVLYEMGFVKNLETTKSVQKDIRNRRRLEWKEIREEKLEYEQKIEENKKEKVLNYEEMSPEQQELMRKYNPRYRDKGEESVVFKNNGNDHSPVVETSTEPRKEVTQAYKEWQEEWKTRVDITDGLKKEFEKKKNTKKVNECIEALDKLMEEWRVKNNIREE